ncbi:MAG: hypothetical protein M1828_005647 [Chrysothrix sp. TS-e1954]|nr:MAG: hypothetical protein M1828_005647 [Chrysothrix sp. TS-e1954]
MDLNWNPWFPYTGTPFNNIGHGSIVYQNQYHHHHHYETTIGGGYQVLNHGNVLPQGYGYAPNQSSAWSSNPPPPRYSEDARQGQYTFHRQRPKASHGSKQSNSHVDHQVHYLPARPPRPEPNKAIPSSTPPINPYKPRRHDSSDVRKPRPWEVCLAEFDFEAEKDSVIELWYELYGSFIRKDNADNGLPPDTALDKEPDKQQRKRFDAVVAHMRRLARAEESSPSVAPNVQKHAGFAQVPAAFYSSDTPVEAPSESPSNPSVLPDLGDGNNTTMDYTFPLSLIGPDDDDDNDRGVVDQEHHSQTQNPEPSIPDSQASETSALMSSPLRPAAFHERTPSQAIDSSVKKRKRPSSPKVIITKATVPEIAAPEVIGPRRSSRATRPPKRYEMTSWLDHDFEEAPVRVESDDSMVEPDHQPSKRKHKPQSQSSDILNVNDPVLSVNASKRTRTSTKPSKEVSQRGSTQAQHLTKDLTLDEHDSTHSTKYEFDPSEGESPNQVDDDGPTKNPIKVIAEDLDDKMVVDLGPWSMK